MGYHTTQELLPVFKESKDLQRNHCQSFSCCSRAGCSWSYDPSGQLAVLLNGFNAGTDLLIMIVILRSLIARRSSFPSFETRIYLNHLNQSSQLQQSVLLTFRNRASMTPASRACLLGASSHIVSFSTGICAIRS